jgi:prefoldin subunit 5
MLVGTLTNNIEELHTAANRLLETLTEIVEKARELERIINEIRRTNNEPESKP